MTDETLFLKPSSWLCRFGLHAWTSWLRTYDGYGFTGHERACLRRNCYVYRVRRVSR